MTRTSGFTLGRRVGQSGHAPRPGYNAVHDDLPAPPHTFGRPAPGPAPGTAALSMDGAVSRGPCPAQRFRTSGPGGGALGGAPEPVASLARPPARHSRGGSVGDCRVRTRPGTHHCKDRKSVV